MAGNENNLWGQHDLSRVCFGLDMDHSLRGIHKDFASLSQAPYFSDSCLSPESLRRPPAPEGDQVVPSAQRGCTVLGQREAKPLPPLPDPEELMSDEAADQEVEFFTSDRRCLLPKSFPKVPCRAGGKQNGKVNHAYQDASLLERDAGSLAFSWPGCDDRAAAARSNHFGASNWDSGDVFWTKPDHPCLSPGMRLSCVVPPVPTDKPEVPPRIPIKPKNLTLSSDDKPPKIPPRVPLVPPCPPRTPSPKSLPIYINGVMPPTQSFAANPNYVSKTPQRHHSERAASTAQPSPCIVPILKDGRQASTTHYILLPPGRPASASRRDRLQSEPTRKSNGGFWKKR